MKERLDEADALTKNEIIECFNNINHSYVVSLPDELAYIMEVQDDISFLKKQIRHCKNPMQKKQLEKKLNDAYKNKRNK